jgi:hypothetical protein
MRLEEGIISVLSKALFSFRRGQPVALVCLHARLQYAPNRSKKLLEVIRYSNASLFMLRPTFRTCFAWGFYSGVRAVARAPSG